jgi:hypothetical protein
MVMTQSLGKKGLFQTLIKGGLFNTAVPLIGISQSCCRSQR